jgi:hypothetical protein
VPSGASSVATVSIGSISKKSNSCS